jgi:hypothetical protein
VPNVCQIVSRCLTQAPLHCATLSAIRDSWWRRSIQFHFVAHLLNRRALLFQVVPLIGRFAVGLGGHAVRGPCVG